MSSTYLEVTYRAGKPLAAYFYLPRHEGDKSARVEKREAGLLVDMTADGRPIGIEIAIPALVTVEAVNRILVSFGLEPIDSAELAPLNSVPPSLERRQGIERLIGFAKTDNPPDDADVKRILDEERMKKYG